MKLNGRLLVEIDGRKNQRHFFRPLGRSLRGRFDVSRIRGDVGRVAQEWPAPIPGQQIEVDPSQGTAAVVEPLHSDEHKTMREKIEATHRLPPAREELGQVDVPTFLHWLQLAVEAGCAQVREGQLPAGPIEGAQKVGFIVTRPPTDSDRLATAIEKQTATIEKLLARLGGTGV